MCPWGGESGGLQALAECLLSLTCEGSRGKASSFSGISDLGPLCRWRGWEQERPGLGPEGCGQVRQVVEGGGEVGCGREGRSGWVLGGGPAPESAGGWSQAGATVFIEPLPSLHAEGWGLGAGGTRRCGLARVSGWS